MGLFDGTKTRSYGEARELADKVSRGDDLTREEEAYIRKGSSVAGGYGNMFRQAMEDRKKNANKSSWF